MTAAHEELARRALDALSHGDADGFAQLVHPEIEIHTARGVRLGREEARAWAAPKFEHLVRRYAVEDLRASGDRVVALAQVEYTWLHSGRVGDRSLVAIVLDFADGKLRRWRLYDDPIEGEEALDR